MRYYSTQRPITPGSYPRPRGNRVVKIVNFVNRTHCEELGRKAWGYIEYGQPLTEKEAANCELVPGENVWYPVTVCSKKHGGGLKIFPGECISSAERPADMLGETKDMQFKTRYFRTRAEAQRIMDTLQALTITAERVRMSVIQGEVRVLINGTHILNFGDNIVLTKRNAGPLDYYGETIGRWRSCKPDSAFVLGLIWHPLDRVYHYSDLVCQKLGIKPEEWIESKI